MGIRFIVLVATDLASNRYPNYKRKDSSCDFRRYRRRDAVDICVIELAADIDDNKIECQRAGMKHLEKDRCGWKNYRCVGIKDLFSDSISICCDVTNYDIASDKRQNDYNYLNLPTAF